jgi:catechol 2,3-dioxygenase-like lactoylglutathione lyase family enzyme
MSPTTSSFYRSCRSINPYPFSEKFVNTLYSVQYLYSSVNKQTVKAGIPKKPSRRRFCYNTGMKVLFVAGYGPITTNTKESAAFYRESLGLSFQEEASGYLHTGEIEGVKHFALWPLAQAAQSCFGVDSWPTDLPTPTSWLELDVEDVAEASEELKAKGYKLLIESRTEPWGQTVTRLLSPEGILVGLTFTPWMR